MICRGDDMRRNGLDAKTIYIILIGLTSFLAVANIASYLFSIEGYACKIDRKISKTIFSL